MPVIRRTTDIFIVAALAFTLGACSAIDIRWPPPGTTTETPAEKSSAATADKPAAPGKPVEVAADADAPSSIPDIHTRLLRQASIWAELAPDAQQAEFSDAERRYAESPTDINLLRLGLYAALTPQEQPGAWRSLRGSLRERLPHMASPDNDELHALAAVVLRMLDDRERLMAQLTSQNEELQHKLNELKSIEQQLRERDSTDIIRTPP